jgi:hypothetical protein
LRVAVDDEQRESFILKLHGLEQNKQKRQEQEQSKRQNTPTTQRGGRQRGGNKDHWELVAWPHELPKARYALHGELPRRSCAA